MTTDPKKVFLRDIMTRKVLSVTPDTPLVEATKIITEHNFDGVPVIDSGGHLVGIITEYDLITKTSGISESFLQQIINDIYTKDISELGQPKTISELLVKDVMNREPLTMKEDATFEQAVETFKSHHKVNPIPIVNDENKVVGIISRFDILRPLNILGYSKKK